MGCLPLLVQCALLLLMIETCWGQQPYIFSDGEQVQNVFSSGGQLIVGTNRALYDITTTSNAFVQRQNRTLQGSNRLLVKANEGIYNNLLVSCDSSMCILAEVSNFNLISWSVSSSIVLRGGTTNAPGLFALSASDVPELLYINSATGSSPVRMIRGSLLNVNLQGSPSNSMFRKGAIVNEAVVENTYQYHLEFSHNGFLYSVGDRHRDEPGPLPTARVLRLCSNDSTAGINFFRSHMEVKLACGANSAAITSATFVSDSNNPFGQPTLVVSAWDSVDRTIVICTYNLSSIDGAMRSKFDECHRGIGKVGFLRYGDTLLEQCRDFTQDAQAVRQAGGSVL